MADTKISPGVHTYKEILELAGVDLDEAVTVDSDSGPRTDFRRVNVGGLGFDDPNQVVVVPDEGETVEVRVDGKLEATLKVDQKKDFRAASDLPDEALLSHVDPQNPGESSLVQKAELEF